MKEICARIENIHISGDAPPEPSEDLALADADDELTEAELARLDEAIERGVEAIKAGCFRPARDVLADLRHRFR